MTPLPQHAFTVARALRARAFRLLPHSSTVFFLTLPLLLLAALPALPALAAREIPVAELHLSTDPAGAACTINGEPHGITPVNLTGLAPDDYLIVIRKTGHLESRRTVTLGAGAREAVDIVLEPERGLVLVQSIPAGAQISLDGADRGHAPLLITDLPLGHHRVRAETPDCLPKEVDLSVENRTPVKLVIQLQSSLAAINLMSTPPGAAVLLDGASRGTSPLLLDRLTPGTHELALNLTGYAPHTRNITLASGQAETIDVTLVPVPARLQVTSIPAGATVYLDNAMRGKTPLTLPNLTPGPYRLRAELPGYATLGRTVTLALAADAREEFRMESNSGFLELVTEPAAVTVFVDGQNVGVTSFGTNETDKFSDPLAVRLLVQGRHTLELTRKGYYSITKNIEIVKDTPLALHETLKRRFIPDYEIITVAGIDQGVLVQVEPNGDVRLEVRPGVIKTIRAADIKAGRPLQQRELPELTQEPGTNAATPPAPAPAP